jgi:hypothetical protein
VNLDGKQYSAFGDSGVKALWGEVGVEAAFAEVAQADEVTRRAIDAPTGYYVVSADSEVPFTVRVFDSAGELLAEIEEVAGWDDDPPWLA